MYVKNLVPNCAKKPLSVHQIHDSADVAVATDLIQFSSVSGLFRQYMDITIKKTAGMEHMKHIRNRQMSTN